MTLPIVIALGHYRSRDPRRSTRHRDADHRKRPPLHQHDQARVGTIGVTPGLQGNRGRAKDQQPPDIAVAPPRDSAMAKLSTAGALRRGKPKPGGELPPASKPFGFHHRTRKRGRRKHPHAGNRQEPPGDLIALVPALQSLIEFLEARHIRIGSTASMHPPPSRADMIAEFGNPE